MPPSNGVERQEADIVAMTGIGRARVAEADEQPRP
jgi:hypothetical protein